MIRLVDSEIADWQDIAEGPAGQVRTPHGEEGPGEAIICYGSCGMNITSLLTALSGSSTSQHGEFEGIKSGQKKRFGGETTGVTRPHTGVMIRCVQCQWETAVGCCCVVSIRMAPRRSGTWETRSPSFFGTSRTSSSADR